MKDDEHGACAKAAALRNPKAAITALSAMWLLGIRLLPRHSPPRLVVPRVFRRGRYPQGISVHHAELPDTDVTPGPHRTTTPLRAAWDTALYEDFVEAVTAIDAAARAGLIRLDELRALADVPRRWGSRRVRRVLALVDPAAESPQESRLRVRLAQHGLPAPTPQHVVRHQGRFVARVDLAWPDACLALEYDGHWHANAEQLRKDRRRLNALISAGWHVVHVTDDRIETEEIPFLVEEIKTVLARRSPSL